MPGNALSFFLIRFSTPFNLAFLFLVLSSFFAVSFDSTLAALGVFFSLLLSTPLVFSSLTSSPPLPGLTFVSLEVTGVVVWSGSLITGAAPISLLALFFFVSSSLLVSTLSSRFNFWFSFLVSAVLDLSSATSASSFVWLSNLILTPFCSSLPPSRSSSSTFELLSSFSGFS